MGHLSDRQVLGLTRITGLLEDVKLNARTFGVQEQAIPLLNATLAEIRNEIEDTLDRLHAMPVEPRSGEAFRTLTGLDG